MSMRLANDKTIDEIMGKRLRELRKASKKTQWDFAELMGITPQQLSKYELGRNCIAASTVVLICRHCKVTPDFFFAELFPKMEEIDISTQLHQRLHAYEALDVVIKDVSVAA